MSFSRRMFLQSSVSAALAPAALAQTGDRIGTAIWAVIAGNPEQFSNAMDVLSGYAKPDIVPSLILARRYSRNQPDRIEAALRRLTGASDYAGWFEWMQWQERNPQIVPHPSFTETKRRIFLSIDPNFEVFLRPEYLKREAMKIRFEEITWGGVSKDGIPSLDKPKLIAAGAADYMKDDDLVFGISVNRDARAYPLRIMGWHEMFNDVIGGVPLALAYCTLCGSGILFETTVKGFSKPLVFGSSGFLYRSNKLMFDRKTNSLWNQFTGRPVVGPLADSGIELTQRPVVIAPWSEWLAGNPSTKVLSVSTGFARDYGSGVVYQDYFSSSELMFPTVVDESKLKQKEYVFGIRTFGAAKAWPLKVFAGGKLINDGLAGQNLVLIGDKGGRTVRAYDRGERVFTVRDGKIFSDGKAWQFTEEALISDDGTRAPRVAGHVAYWFAWNGYLGAESELYEGG